MVDFQQKKGGWHACHSLTFMVSIHEGLVLVCWYMMRPMLCDVTKFNLFVHV